MQIKTIKVQLSVMRLRLERRFHCKIWLSYGKVWISYSLRFILISCHVSIFVEHFGQLGGV